MLNKTLFEFLATNPPPFWVSDFRVITSTSDGLKTYVDCVLQTQTQHDLEPKGTLIRLSIEAAEALVSELQSRIADAKMPLPPASAAH